MTATLDWAAPILPGKSMMGLDLGMSRTEVLARLWAHRCDPGNPDLIRFANSPLLIVDNEDAEGIDLRGADIKPVHYAWQNLVATLIFEAARLVCIRVLLLGDAPYQGRLFDKIGLGSRVSDLRPFCTLKYDAAEEWFYPLRGFTGLKVSGRARDLFTDPDQPIASIWVFEYSPGPWSYSDYKAEIAGDVQWDVVSQACSVPQAIERAYEELQARLDVHQAEKPLALVAMAMCALGKDVLARLPLMGTYGAALRKAVAPTYVAEVCSHISGDDGKTFMGDAEAVRQALERIGDEPETTHHEPWTYSTYEAMIEVDADWAMAQRDYGLNAAVRWAYDAHWQRLMALPEETPMAFLAVAVYVLGKGQFDRLASTVGWEPGFRDAIAPDQVARITQSQSAGERDQYLSHVNAVRQAFDRD